MQPSLINSSFPVFEANQVLSNRHLNQVFNYLDEQDRLTRANLIGIGIVCGLEVNMGGTAASPVVHISKGCGVTSEGYLIVEPKDLELVSYKTYNQPDVHYPLFNGLAISEMFEEGEPHAKLFTSNPGFLNDKVVLLFLELKKESLRNCSPNNCDDKGAEVSCNVRKLLIGKGDMKKIIAQANKLSVDITPFDLKAYLEVRLNLPDLALPRYNVPNTAPITSFDLLSAYFRIFRDNQLAFNTVKALSQLYKAFQPILVDQYPVDPFSTFKFDHIDSALKTTAEVRFLQYFYDFFDDLLRAYDEFRSKGLDLLCACCPPETLFPRHLMLGLLVPDAEASIYRHTFLASGAIHDCEQREEELRLLFRRIIEMIGQFNEVPLLSTPQFQTRPFIIINSLLDEDIRITPSKFGDVPLSKKAIPYYYIQNNNPTLYHYWSPEKNRIGKEDQNLSYWADHYASRVFVQKPLEYDLEPYNFLRIEGHLGKNYKTVLRTLLTQRSLYRLPISIIALRSGAFDEKIKLDLADYSSSFEDLDALYHATREQWLGFLCKELTYLYSLSPNPQPSTRSTQQAIKSKFSFINTYAPGFMVEPDTLGRVYELTQGNNSGNDTILRSRFVGQNFDSDFYKLFTSILKLADNLPADLSGFQFPTFNALYKSMQSSIVNIEADRENKDGKGDLRKRDKFLTWEELDDRLEDLIYSCRIEAFKSIYGEYLRRIKAIKQKQFLSNFLLQHPGIQHKAGVPIGGTFIIVYHDDPDPILPPFPITSDTVDIAVDLHNIDQLSFVDPINTEGLPAVDSSDTQLFNLHSSERDIAYRAIRNIGYDRELMSLNKDIRDLVAIFTGQVPHIDIDETSWVVNPDDIIIKKAVDEIADETVIADFYLPYLCYSDFTPIQFVLPSAPVSFTVKLGCTDVETKKAPASITVHSGVGPFYFKLGELAFQELTGAVLLPVGKHKIIIRDTNNIESTQQEITVLEPLTISKPTFKCSVDDSKKMDYIVSFDILGGLVPYATDSGNLKGNTFFSNPVASGSELIVNISDKAGCKFSQTFIHTCPTLHEEEIDKDNPTTTKSKITRREPANITTDAIKGRTKKVVSTPKSRKVKTNHGKADQPSKERRKPKIVKKPVSVQKTKKATEAKVITRKVKPKAKTVSTRSAKVVAKKSSPKKKK